MSLLVVILIGILALVFGLGVGWILKRSESQKKMRELDGALLEANQNLNQLRFERENLKEDLAKTDGQLETQRQEVLRLSRLLAEAQATQKGLETRLIEQKAEVEELNKKFANEFKNLANEIFEEKSKKFTVQNKENLGELLNPLREKILEFQKKVEDTNTAGEKRSAALSEQLRNLKELNQQITSEAKSLSMALRGDSKTQGNWGELQLESILQKAGLQKDIHYSKEQNFKNEEGKNQRLDYILHLPDGKHLILDSKVSLSAYSRYFEAADDREREKHLRDHMLSIHAHIKLLAEKNYQSLYDINTPDYVLMFIANEPALGIALQQDPEIYDKALRRNLVIVTTTTLMATLSTISYIWKQDLQNKNAEEIARQAGALYDKFVGFTDDLTKIGSQLKTVQNTYNDSMKKLVDGTGNLVRRAEKLKELGAKSTKDQNLKLLDRAD